MRARVCVFSASASLLTRACAEFYSDVRIQITATNSCVKPQPAISARRITGCVTFRQGIQCHLSCTSRRAQGPVQSGSSPVDTFQKTIGLTVRLQSDSSSADNKVQFPCSKTEPLWPNCP